MGQEIAIQELPRPALTAGHRPTAIVPTDMDSCYRLAKAVCIAGMAPAGLDTPEKAMVAIMHGLEIGLTPMAALQRIAVVNGRPTIWGDGAIGLVRGSGLCEFIKERIDGEGDARIAICEAKRKGDDSIVTRKFSVVDAKLAGLWSPDARVTRKSRDGGTYQKDNDSPWHRYPERMLQMRARAFALRDLFADVLGGLYLREEIEDDTAPRRAAPPPPTIPAPIEHEPVKESSTTSPRRAPPPPPQSKPVAPTSTFLDPAALQAKFATALCAAFDEETANDAYTVVVGPHEKGLADSEVEAFLQMLRNRIAELEP